jgi:hypothetical protein
LTLLKSFDDENGAAAENLFLNGVELKIWRLALGPAYAKIKIGCDRYRPDVLLEKMTAARWEFNIPVVQRLFRSHFLAVICLRLP